MSDSTPDGPTAPGAPGLTPLGAGQARLRLRAGDAELLFEGSEEFLRELMPTVLDRLVSGPGEPATQHTPAAEPAPPAGGSPAHDLARELGIAVAHVDEALAPSTEPPWLRIDPHHWAIFKDKTPRYGRNSANDVQFVAMALNLWFRQLGRDAPSLADVRATVRSSHLATKNATRSVENSAALQRRGEAVTVRPSEHLRARRIVRAFCLQEPLAPE